MPPRKVSAERSSAIRADVPAGARPPVVVCPHCNKNVLTLCLFCPHCDEPLPDSREYLFQSEAEAPGEERSFLAFAWFGLAILGGLGIYVAVVCLILAVLGGGNVVAAFSILAVLGTVPGLGLLFGGLSRVGGGPGVARPPLLEQVFVVVGIQVLLMLLLFWLVVSLDMW
jgi:hypothetical protein